jgi:hypothetical protein
VRDGLPPVEFRLGPGRTIRGHVVDSSGKPVGGAIVALAGWGGPPTLNWQAWTDAEGRFVWDGAPPGRFTVRVESDGYRAAEMPIEPSRDDPVLTLAISAPLRIRWTVADAATGREIESFRVVPGMGAQLTMWRLP